MSLANLPYQPALADNPFQFQIKSASRSIFKDARIVIDTVDIPDDESIDSSKSDDNTTTTTTSKNENDPFKTLNLLELIDKSKFSIYLAETTIDSQQYAVKVFHYDSENNINSLFTQEAKFKNLDHPNILKIHHLEEEANIRDGGVEKRASFVVLEYAPYGDFSHLLSSNKVNFSEKLSRTYFRQLINGLEYLHKIGHYHLDIKPGNLLIDKNFNLKIADFDGSYIETEDESCINNAKVIKNRGSKFFRSLELYFGNCINPAASDICSAGLVLFWFYTSGHLAHHEDNVCRNMSFLEMLYQNPDQFWKTHQDLLEKGKDFFSMEFRDLFLGMVDNEPKKRLTLDQIKEHKWYLGEYFEDTDELKSIMLELVEKNKQKT